MNKGLNHKRILSVALSIIMIFTVIWQPSLVNAQVITDFYQVSAKQAVLTLLPGASGTLEVQFDDGEVPKGTQYFWYRGVYTTGDPIEGVNGPSMDVTAQDYGRFICKVTYPGGYSTVYFSVEIDNQLTARAENANIVVTPGQKARMEVKVSASDMTDLKFKWETGNKVVADADEAVLEVDVDYNKSYICRVTDRFGNAVSVRFELKVDNQFTLKAENNIEDFEIPGDGSVDLKVVTNAIVTEGISYRWEKSGSTLLDENSDTLYVDAESALNGYVYTCTAWDKFGNYQYVSFWVYANNHLEVKAAQANYEIAPYGKARIEVDVTADDMEGITYDWGTEFPDVDTPYMVVSPSTSKVYRCTVRDTKFRDSKMVNIVVTINNHLEVNAVEEDITVPIGVKPRLQVTVKADSFDGITYEWRRWSNNGSELMEGANGPTYEAEADKPAHYSCTVTDSFSGLSENANFYVDVENHFNAKAEQNEFKVNPGTSIVLKPIVSGDDLTGVTYQWNCIQGYNFADNTLSQQEVQVSENSGFWCYVTDRFGHTESVSFSVHMDNSFFVEAAEETITQKVGEKAKLEAKVQAFDKNGITYTWRKQAFGTTGSEVIEGENGAVLEMEFDGDYRIYCDVNDAYGNRQTVSFVVNLDNQLKIEIKQVPEKADVGEMVTLTANVTALNDKDLKYRWTTIDFTADTREIEVVAKNSQTYYCWVTDAYGKIVVGQYTVKGDNHFSAKALQQTVSITPGNNAELTVAMEAIDKSKANYVWYKAVNGKWEKVEGENSEVLSFLPQKTNEQYYCYVTDGYGSYATVTFMVKIDNNLSIKPAQSTVTIRPGEKKTLEARVTALESEGLYYTWQKKNGNNYEIISGESGLTLEVSAPTKEEHDAYYWCTVHDHYGNTNGTSFHVCLDNELTARAVSSAIQLERGASGQLEVLASAADPDSITYRWYKNDNYQFSLIEGETGNTLKVAAGEGRQYVCTVSDRYYSKSYDLYFYVNVENHFFAFADQNEIKIMPGEKAQLHVNVQADDKEGISYKWYNADTGTLMVDEITDTITCGVGTYTCQVQDRYQNMTSFQIKVVVDNHLDVVSDQSVIYINPGENAVMKVNASAENDVGMTFTWYKLEYSFSPYTGCSLSYYNGLPALEGVTGDTCEIVNVTNYSGYRCIISDCYGNKKNIDFTIIPQNHFWAEAENNVICVDSGSTVDLRVKVAADQMDGVTYEWYEYNLDTYSMSRVFSASSAELTLNGVKKQEQYRCMVKDRYGNGECVDFVVLINGAYVGGTAFSVKAAETPVYVKKGEKARLKVNVTADESEDLTYSWYDTTKGAQLVAQGPNLSSFETEGIETLSSYRCVVTDSKQNELSAYFTVRVENGLLVEALSETEQMIPKFGSTVLKARVSAVDEEDLDIQWSYFITGENGRVLISREGLDENNETSIIAEVSDKSRRYILTVKDKYQTVTELIFQVTVDNGFEVEAVMGEGYYTKEDGTIVIDADEGEDLIIKLNVRANDQRSITYTWSGYRQSPYQYDIYMLSPTYIDLRGTAQDNELFLSGVTQDTIIRVNAEDRFSNSKTLQYEIRVKKEVVKDLKFAGALLTLEDNLAIRFNVNKTVIDACGVTDPYVAFRFNGKEITVTDYIDDNEKGKYGFVLHNIAPQQMNDTVTATLYAKKGNTIIKGRTINLSVADYCCGMLEGKTDETRGALDTLLVDLMFYGDAAQILMNYKTDALVTSRLTETQKTWRSTNNLDLKNYFSATYEKVDSPSVKWKGAGLFLEETVAIRYRFMADDYNGITIKVTDENGHEWTYDMSSPEVKVATEGGYYLYFNGLNAGQMRDKVYATIYRNEERVSHTVRYSVESYVYGNQGSADAAFLNLINSMLRYGDSANAYANKQQEQ